jgi:hypothetical protein
MHRPERGLTALDLRCRRQDTKDGSYLPLSPRAHSIVMRRLNFWRQVSIVGYKSHSEAEKLKVRS